MKDALDWPFKDIHMCVCVWIIMMDRQHVSKKVGGSTREPVQGGCTLTVPLSIVAFKKPCVYISIKSFIKNSFKSVIIT